MNRFLLVNIVLFSLGDVYASQEVSPEAKDCLCSLQQDREGAVPLLPILINPYKQRVQQKEE